MNTLELLGILKSFLPLCKEEKEYGGLINLRTGEIDGPFEGGYTTVSEGSAGEVRAKGERGLVGFHTHPVDTVPEPSREDIYAAHVRGTPEYVITTQDIYEVKPIMVLPLLEVQMKNLEAERLAEECEAEKVQLSTTDAERWAAEDAFWDDWERLLKEFLPTTVTLLEDPLAEPSSDRGVTASS
jgi:hypothetical protein